MANPIEKNAAQIIRALFENNPKENLLFDGDEIVKLTGLNSKEINNAIDFLDNQGLLNRRDYLGTRPYNFGNVALNSLGNHEYYELFGNAEDEQEETNVSIMEIFISHSHKDQHIAKELIELLRFALNLRTEDIRCTSVDGYRLPAGISTDQQLKLEIHESKVLIGLISPASISSYYVLFELGARWGADKPLIPLITSVTGHELLKGPLQGINALNAFEEAQLFQLVTDLSKILDLIPEKPESYQHQIKKLAASCRIVEGQGIEDGVIENELESFDEYERASELIKKHCTQEWPDDFNMQVSCIQEQEEALKILKKGRPDDISNDDFILVRKKAAEDWPDDYHMRVSVEKEQYDAIRKLKKM